MTWMLVLIVSVTGGLGAVLRYLVDTGAKRVWPNRGPLGIFVVNLSAAFLVGLIAPIVARGWLSATPLWEVALITGLLGGYSTFSAVMVDSVRLLESRRTVWLLVNTLGMLILGVLASAAGIVIGSALAG